MYKVNSMFRVYTMSRLLTPYKVEKSFEINLEKWAGY